MLKYLFTAEYNDGTTYQQTPEDVSKTDPKRSCFYDIDHDRLVAFVLKGNGHEYGVNLVTGEFKIDGLPFTFHEEALGRPALPLELEKRGDKRLIFWRRHKHTIQQSRDKDVETGHEITYDLGWQTNVGSQNYQRIIHIN